jgi:hypothetical protein
MKSQIITLAGFIADENPTILGILPIVVEHQPVQPG